MCGNIPNMGLKDRFSKKDKVGKTDGVKKELHEEYNEDKKQVVGHAKRIKQLWRTKEVLQLKTDAIAVLWKKKGYEVQFFEEFDKITKAGYQLVLMEGIKALDAGPIDIKIGSYYYFQHKSCIR
jgi:hypothetical protein